LGSFKSQFRDPADSLLTVSESEFRARDVACLKCDTTKERMILEDLVSVVSQLGSSIAMPCHEDRQASLSFGILGSLRSDSYRAVNQRKSRRIASTIDLRKAGSQNEL
jgi:hypothetical protein